MHRLALSAFVLVALTSCDSPPRPEPVAPYAPPVESVALGGLEWVVDDGGVAVVAADYRARADGSTVAIEVGDARAAFTTRSIRRGGHDLARHDADAHLDGDRLTFTRERVVESWRATSGVLEQSWSFEHAPPGDGPLAIAVAIQGAEDALETEHGIELAAAETRMLYTHGVWIDAAGTRTPVPARWTGSEITLEVPADVLAQSAYPAILDPLVGAPVAVSEALYVANAEYHDETHVFWSGTSYVAVAGAPGATVRVSSTGTILDVPERRIPYGCSGAYAYASFSRLVVVGARAWLFCENRYLVIEADGSASSWVDLPSGVLVRDAATDGTQIMIVWSRSDGVDDNVYAMRIALDGTALDPIPITISAAPGPQNSPSIAWLGSTFFVAYSDRRYPESPSDVLGTRVSPAGVVASPDGLPLASSISFAEGAPIVTAGPPGDHLLTFYRTTGASPELHAVRLDDLGADAGVEFRIGAVAGAVRAARVGAEWLIPYIQSYRLGVVAFTPATGTYRFETLTSFAGAQFDASIASDGTTALLTWHGETSTVRVTQWHGDLIRSGSPTTRIPLTTRASTSHTRVDLVPGGTEYLARFSEGRAPSVQAYARGVSGAGTPIGARTYLASALATGPMAPGGAGGAYALANTPAAGLVGVRFLDATGVPTGSGSTVSARYSSSWVWGLARGPAGGYVAVLSYWGGASGVQAARFRDDGTPVDTSAYDLTLSAGEENEPAIGGSSGGYLAAWIDTRDGTTNPNVYGIRLDAAGELLDRASIAIGTGPEDASAPRVSRCGDGWIVSWESSGSSSHESAHWAFVSAAGVAGPVTTIASTGGLENVDVIAGWGGAHALVLWTRGRSETTTIHGRTVDASGVPSGTDFVVAVDEAFTAFGSLVSNGADDFQLAYLRTDPRDRLPRAYLRRISLDDTLGGACSSSSECASGHCIDGVCCISACGGGVADCMACSVAAGATVDGLCGVVAAGAVCRSASGACDVTEVCDGAATACPADAHADDGTWCADEDVCDGEEACFAGACGTGRALRCDDADLCTHDACDPAVGCTHEPDLSCGDAGLDAGGGGLEDAGGTRDAGGFEDAGDAGDAGPISGDAAGIDGGHVAMEDAGVRTTDSGVLPVDGTVGCGCRVGTARTRAGPMIASILVALIALVARRTRVAA